MKADLKAERKKTDYLKREAALTAELHNTPCGLATKAEMRGLIAKEKLRGIPTKEELHRVAADEVRKHVTEALVPTEKKIASLSRRMRI